MPTIQDIEFLQLHWEDDPVKLLLSSAKHPNLDLPWIAQQIEGRVQAQTKWPTLSQDERIWYPKKLNREQSSSEELGKYKKESILRLCSILGIGTSNLTVADLTGGFGIDTYHFSQIARTVDYVELDKELCQTASHNFETLRAGNICCHNSDSVTWIDGQKEFDIVYIDPARRGANGKKVCAFEDCTPNLLDNLDMILSHCKLLVVKASPMISIPQALEQLKEVLCVEVAALKGECKEVLFFVGRQAGPLQIRAIDIHPDGASEVMEYQKWEEAAASEKTSYCSDVETYLYEPNAAIMKAGCHNLVGTRYCLCKLARNTHLYTSEQLIENFPGRAFRILEEAKPKDIAKLIPEKKAHVAIRNYPISASELQKKLKLHEGGHLYVIGTTIGTQPKLFLCERLF